MIALSKFQGNYLQFKDRIRQHGIKWVKPDNFAAFLNILNSKHDDLKEWYKAVQNVLSFDY
jgi:hypothetical protein